ncbi:MAG: GNAT family N-acetyltransferase [Oscillospiraceae bacterium]|nr:GNAT family N-acetyltransferase [Oscillospiraceae bacterium]
MNPYKNCPAYETQNFVLRLVSENDADDLLTCYSDPKAQEFFNIDNFPIDCKFNTTDEMLKCIKYWLMEYEQEAYIRFAIIDKSTNRAVGTIEMFGMVGKYKTEVGILRIDIASIYEKDVFLSELFRVCVENFYTLFEVEGIATKAVNNAVERVSALKKLGFQAEDYNGRSHYYLLYNT